MKKHYHFYGLLAAILIFTGCSAFRHGYTTRQYQEQLLSAKSGPGKDRLKIEMDYDATVRNYVLDKGTPDYIYVVDIKQVLLVSIKRDEVVKFTRPTLSPYSKLSFKRPIPDNFIEQISFEDQKQLAAIRLDHNKIIADSSATHGKTDSYPNESSPDIFSEIKGTDQYNLEPKEQPDTKDRPWMCDCSLYLFKDGELVDKIGLTRQGDRDHVNIRGKIKNTDFDEATVSYRIYVYR